MEKPKQGFFSAALRGLAPAKSRSKSPSRSPSPAAALLLPLCRKGDYAGHHSLSNLPQLLVERSGSLRPGREALAPLMEGPDPDSAVSAGGEVRRDGWGKWVKGHLSRAPSVSATAGGGGRSDFRLLLGVMGAPLAPIHVSAAELLPHLSIKDAPIETLSAQYILQQYTAASGGLKLQSAIRNSYATGKVRMVASEFETATKVVRNRSGTSRAAEPGSFVLWQMAPDKWFVELAVGGSKVHAGCNGRLVWRHTPWLGTHAAKGPVRPLRRALQGLDPLTTARMFANARCIGEKKLNGEDCFILKLCADPQTLRARSEDPAEIIQHILFGYFSQRTGLLVHMEDSHLTRIQSNGGGDAVYWETTINSFLDDYCPVEGIMIAHTGRSVVTLFRFDEVAMSHTKTRMEEAWTIDEVAFNVPGLSVDCFLPPADIRCGSISEACELPQGERGRNTTEHHQAKVTAVEKHQDTSNNIIWKVEI